MDRSHFYYSSVWRLAGASSDGILYAVSMDPAVVMGFNLWAFNAIQDKWTIVARSKEEQEETAGVDEYGNDPDEWYVNFQISAVYNQQLGVVDVFVQRRRMGSLLIHFSTYPREKFQKALVAERNDNLQLDYLRKMSLQYIGDKLILAGWRDPPIRFVHEWCIFQLLVDEQRNTFELAEVWSANRFADEIPCYSVVGDRLLTVNQIVVFCHTPPIGDSPQRWNTTSFRKTPWKCGTSPALHLAQLCPSLTTTDGLWITQKGGTILEAIIERDGRLVVKQRAPIQVNAPVPDTDKSVVATASHIFVVTSEYSQENGEIINFVTKTIGVAPLQYLCMSKLASTLDAFRFCESEEDAVKLDVPALAWRRFCR